MALHLVVPDTHCKPGVTNERLLWAGRLALHRRPDVIIQLGDFADMPSLSAYDKGLRSFEGRRYKSDIAAAVDGNEKFFQPLKRYNARRAKNKKQQYKPRLIKLRGNHEERIMRAANSAPELEGTLSYADFKDEEFGWKTHDFLEIIEVDGIYYSHYFSTGNSNNAIAGQYPGLNILRTNMVSSVCGHSHVRDFCERTGADNKRIMSLVAGCYFDHTEGWATPKQNVMWWRGLVLLEVHDGGFDPEFISLERVKALYGTS